MCFCSADLIHYLGILHIKQHNISNFVDVKCNRRIITTYTQHYMLMDLLMNGRLTPTSLEMQVVATGRYHTQYLLKGSTIQLN